MSSRLLAPVRGWESRRARRAERRRADAELLASRLPSPRLAWRTAELVADEHRLELGRSLTDAVHASDERRLPGAAPLDRVAVRGCRAQLLELAARLCDLDEHVAPRGILLVQRLLEDDGSPLYGHADPMRLRRAAVAAQEALAGS